MKKAQYRRFTRSKFGNVLIFLILLIFGSFSLLPLLYCVTTSFKPLDELLIFPPRFFVNNPTVENYKILPTLLANLKVPLSRYIVNSVYVAVLGTVLHILVASAAAFCFSKTNMKLKGLFFAIVQFALLYNAVTLGVPRYLIFSKLKMIDTMSVYIVPYIPSALGVFLMKQYMDESIPEAIIEAAKIDGAGYFRIFTQVAMPMVKPAWLTLTLFAFKDLWALQPSGTIFSENLKTLIYATASVASGGLARSGSAMAITVIMMIPPIIIYLISQSNVTETMSSSGIK